MLEHDLAERGRDALAQPSSAASATGCGRSRRDRPDHLEERQREDARAVAVQSQGEPGKTVQPRTRSTRSAGGDQAAAEVVQQLPALQGGGGLCGGPIAPPSRPSAHPARARARPEPGQELPVAADPSVLAAGVGVVARREVVEQLGVARAGRSARSSPR